MNLLCDVEMIAGVTLGCARHLPGTEACYCPLTAAPKSAFKLTYLILVGHAGEFKTCW